MKERVNYIVDNGKFVASPVNLPQIVVQANSEEEMKEYTKELIRHVAKVFADAANNDELEFKKVDKL